MYIYIYTQHDNNMITGFYGCMGGYPPSFGHLNAESGDEPLVSAHCSCVDPNIGILGLGCCLFRLEKVFNTYFRVRLDDDYRMA
jgi:hypothetical protein